VLIAGFGKDLFFRLLNLFTTAFPSGVIFSTVLFLRKQE
jgi:hypothetical protein